jgi:hypothetical protein
LLKKIQALEEARREDKIKAAKSQVRSLAAAGSPKEQLLSALDDLIEAARAVDSPDLELYRELRLQAFDPSGPSFHVVCQNIFTNQHSDRLSSAVQKAAKFDRLMERTNKGLKENSPSSEKQTPVGQTSEPTAPVQPLQSVAAPTQAPMLWPQQFPPMGQHQSPLQGLYPQQVSFPRGYGYGQQQSQRVWRRRRNCNFCNDENHFMRDCPLLKKMKEKL